MIQETEAPEPQEAEEEVAVTLATAPAFLAAAGGQTADSEAVTPPALTSASEQQTTVKVGHPEVNLREGVE